MTLKTGRNQLAAWLDLAEYDVDDAAGVDRRQAILGDGEYAATFKKRDRSLHLVIPEPGMIRWMAYVRDAEAMPGGESGPKSKESPALVLRRLLHWLTRG